jgi:hypothetical protein
MPAQRSQNGRPDFERDLLAQLAARRGRRAVIKQDELDLDGHGLHELQFDPPAGRWCEGSLSAAQGIQPILAYRTMPVNAMA